MVIEFPSEAKAEDVREKLLAIQKEYLTELGDAFVAAKDDREWIKVNQLFQPVAHGVVSGMLWGLLVCHLFMMPRTSDGRCLPAFEQQLARSRHQ
jgi:uncharacterized membrane protein